MTRNRALDESDLTVIMVAILSLIFVATTLTAFVYGLATAGSLFSVFALPATVIVFWAARQLRLKMRRARASVLREEDRQNIAHMASTINLCKSLAAGTSGSKSHLEYVLAMHHIARYIGTSVSLHGYLLSDRGKKMADRVHVSALAAIADNSCSDADLADVLNGLGHLDKEILDLDGDILENRRAQRSDAGDHAT